MDIQTSLELGVDNNDRCTLWHGDMAPVLWSLPAESFPIIAIDPPYATNNAKKKYDTDLMRRKRWTNFHAEWDVFESHKAYMREVTVWVEALRHVLDRDGSLWVCGSHHSIPAWDTVLKRMGFWVLQWCQWCIPNSMPQLAMTQMVSANQTMIWARKSKKGKHVYRKDVAKEIGGGVNLRDYWLINNDSQAGRKWKHPSKKPVELLKRQIRLTSRPGDPVLDCFAGSGTSGEAALSLGHPCTLVEKHGPYIPMIEQRLHVTHQVGPGATRKRKGNRYVSEPRLPLPTGGAFSESHAVSEAR